jgi:hypothetical protein
VLGTGHQLLPPLLNNAIVGQLPTIQHTGSNCQPMPTVHLLLCLLSCRPSAFVKPESRQLPLLLHTRSVTSAPAAKSTAGYGHTESYDGLLSLLELVAGNEVGASIYQNQ